MDPIVITGDSRLLQFFYRLLQDKMPSGEIEEILNNVTDKQEVTFSNPFTLLHAKDVVARLTSASDTTRSKS